MYRSKRIVFISNCIINQNVVVNPLARAKGPYKDIIKTIMNHNIGIHQISCPEFEYLGLSRPPMTKQEYDTSGYRSLCKNIALNTLEVLKEYLEHDYNIIGIIGINCSPSCSIHGEMGIMMEEFLEVTEREDIYLNTIDVPTDYYDGQKAIGFIKELKIFLKDNIN